MRSLPRGAVRAIVTVVALGASGTDPLEPVPLVPTEPEATTAVQSPLVVAGIGGLRWDDVSPQLTPALWSLLDDGADAGAVTVFTSGLTSCPDGGWLSLSAGRPVPASSFASLCLPLPDVSAIDGGAQVTGWSELAADRADTIYRPRIGTLGAALAQSGVCATAVGPGAALALADLVGSVARYSAELTEGVFDCPLTVVDLGAMAALELVADETLAVDAALSQLLDQLPAESDLLISSVSAPMQADIALGVGVVVPGRTEATVTRSGHFLTSASTRWDGVFRLLDLPSTMTAALGVPEPAQFTGSPVTVGATRPGTAKTVVGLAEQDRIDRSLRAVSATLTNTLGMLVVLLIAMSALVLRPGPRGARRRGLRLVPTAHALESALLTVAAAPLAACLVGLVPWWRSGSGSPVLTMWAAIAAIALAVVSAIKLVKPRSAPIWWPALVVSGLTVVVVLADAVLGTPLLRLSPLGPSVVTGGRYYGIGNATFAILAADAVIFAGALAASMLARNRRFSAVLAVGSVGAVAVLIDIWPAWGADLGGGPALLPAFAVLAILISGARLTWRRALLSAGGVITVIAGIAMLDWLRPPTVRSHAGRFVQSVLDGEAWQTVERKGAFALATSTRGLVPLLSIGVFVVLIVWVRSPDRFAPRAVRDMFDAVPTFRPTCIALLIALGLGALANDYGVRVITIGLIAALPLMAAMTLAAAQRHQSEAPTQRAQAGGKLPARGSNAGTSWPS